MKARPKSITARELNRSLALYASAAPNPERAAQGDALLRRPERAKRAATARPAPDKGASESAVLNAVLGLLRRHPAVAWAHRMNVAAFEAEDRYVRCGWLGASDIIGQMRDGRILCVECKRERGGQVSEAQQTFLDVVREHGGVSGVVRSATEAEMLIRYSMNR